jgi:predicted ATPase/class 3 adenylate cyclase
MRQLPRGTVTFLFTDIEGSTRLLNELGDEYAAVLAEHRRLLRHAFERHGGVEVDTQGDAFFVAFARAGDALAAAQDAQAALAEEPIDVRMGIHSGEPILMEEGYVGIDVHRAARICAAAHGGQVVLSERTRVLVDGDFDLRDLGLHKLKDLTEPDNLFQLAGGEFPPLHSLNATNLPTQPSLLIGRDHELGELLQLVPERRLLTLTGAGGSGKTRLALQVAAELVDEFKDGVFWVPLAALRDPKLVLPTIAQTLGAKVELAEHVAEKRLLLLLDNLEHLLDAAPALSELLQASPNLHMVVTSRAALRIEGECEYGVEPLPEAEAIALFRERAAVSEPEAAVREICARLDRLPLAIELAAARTRILPPEKLLKRLEQRLPLLSSGRRDAPERQRTLRATIAWSYELLAPEEQQLFAGLSVFAGSFELEAAEAVVEARVDELGALVEKSLLRQTGDGRLFMLETIREYALERLDSSVDAEKLRRMHAEHFLQVAEESEREARGPSEDQWLRRLKSDHGNFRASLSWSLERSQAELALRLAGALHSFWYHAGFLAEGRRWAERALAAAAEDEFPRAQAKALSTAGEFANLAGDIGSAKGYLERSLALYKRAGDTGALPAAYTQLGHVALLEGDYELARNLYERVLEHESSNPWCTRGVAFNNLGVALLEAGRVAEARAMLERGLVETREERSSLTAVALLQNLAWAALLEHDLTRCASLLGESCELLKEVPDPQLIWEGLELCAWLAAARDVPREAARLAGAAAAQRTSLGVADRLTDFLAPRESYFDDARLKLGEADWDNEWQLGEMLALEDALEAALKSLD